MNRVLLLMICIVPLSVLADKDLCGVNEPASREAKQECLSQLSVKYQQAEAEGNLKEAYRVIKEEVLPFIEAEESRAIRTEELLMNLSRIKSSLEQRMQTEGPVSGGNKAREKTQE